MKFVRELLRSKEPKASALRQALADLPIAAAAETLSSAEVGYRQQLLDGDHDGELEATERAIIVARREHTRILAFREALQAQLATAEERERLEALATVREGAEKEARDVAALFTKRYGALVAEIVAMLERLEAAESRVVAANHALSAAGFVDRVHDVEGRFIAGQDLVAGRRMRHFIVAGGLA